MKKILGVLGLIVLLLAAWLGFAPVPIEARAWQAPKDAGYVGPYAPNNRLAGLQTIALGADVGPEHVAIGPDGKLYAAVASGAILRMALDGGGLEVFARTGGRVLGFDFDAAGNLVAADAMRGLLSVDPQGKLEVLAQRVGDDPIRYADAVVVARSGRIYFSDASRRFGAREFDGTFEASVLDILEHSSTGRILEYDPATKEVRTVIRDLCFANGVALSADERHLFVAETGEYRVWKVAVDANDVSAKAVAEGGDPRAIVLMSNLPGYPDNLMRGTGGRLWLGFAKPRGKAVDEMADKPFLRELTLRLPRALWPVPPAYGHVIAFDEDGRVLLDLQDPKGSYPETTGVTETPERLYIQSLHAKALGWMPKPEAIR